MHFTTAQPAIQAQAHHYWPGAQPAAATTQSIVALPQHSGGQVPISYVTASQATADFAPFALTQSMAANTVAHSAPAPTTGIIAAPSITTSYVATPRVMETAPAMSYSTLPTYTAPTVVESAPVTYAAPTVVESAPMTYAAPTTMSYIAPQTYAAPTTTYAAPPTYAAPLTTTTSMIALPQMPAAVAGYPTTTTTTTPAAKTAAKTPAKKAVKSAAKPKGKTGCCH